MKANQQYRIWWAPQVPGKVYKQMVKSPEEGWTILETLALYDAFLYKHNHRLDYSNVGGLEMSSASGEWFDFEDAEGRTLSEFMSEEHPRLVAEFRRENRFPNLSEKRPRKGPLFKGD